MQRSRCDECGPQIRPSSRRSQRSLPRRSTRFDEYMGVATDLQSLRQTSSDEFRRIMRSQPAPHPVLRNRHDQRRVEPLKLPGTPVPQPIAQPCSDRLPAPTLCRENGVAHDVAVFRRGKDALEPESVPAAVAAAVGSLDMWSNRGRATKAIPLDDRQLFKTCETGDGFTRLETQVDPAEGARFRQDQITNGFRHDPDSTGRHVGRFWSDDPSRVTRYHSLDDESDI